MSQRDRLNRITLQAFQELPSVAAYLKSPRFRDVILATSAGRSKAIAACRKAHGEKEYRKFVNAMRNAIGLQSLGGPHEQAKAPVRRQRHASRS